MFGMKTICSVYLFVGSRTAGKIVNDIDMRYDFKCSLKSQHIHM